MTVIGLALIQADSRSVRQSHDRHFGDGHRGDHVVACTVSWKILPSKSDATRATSVRKKSCHWAELAHPPSASAAAPGTNHLAVFHIRLIDLSDVLGRQSNQGVVEHEEQRVRHQRCQ
ncbi:MAG: hypothetical protein JXO22_07950, partial [Phycisphaerae bacterium]|nr:hypothetical protein [Phycisphaerae bacterium]